MLFCYSYAGIGMYSNSYISPNSADENVEYKETVTAQRTSGPRDIRESESETYVTSSSEISNGNDDELKSSAEPIILHRTTGIDDLTSYKNVADVLETNDVEYSGRRDGYYIQPSSTIKTEGENDAFNAFTNSGEVKGAPQGRSIPLLEPQEISPSATMAQNIVTPSLRPGQQGRQANPDIQDIITGIVKLLNGNVNVQANTAPAMARPLRPLSTRINNRGPPRITDVPVLPPDFDVPAPPLPPPPLSQMTPPVSTTRLPTPYPFDIPPQNTSPIKPFVSGVPLPEQIVPSGSNKRPGLYRPVTISPWNRPPHRRPPQRRPIPAYKPLPPVKISDESVSLTSEKPMEDIFTLDLGGQLQPSSSEEDITSEEDDDFTTMMNEDTTNNTSSTQTENIYENLTESSYTKIKNKEDSVDKISKEIENKMQTDQDNIKIQETSKDSSESKTEIFSTAATNATTLITTNVFLNSSSTTTDTIAPTKSSTIIPTSANTSLNNTEHLNSSIIGLEGIGEATPMLESSIQEVMQTLKEELLNPSSSSTPTPTEGLPTVVATSSKTTQESSDTASPNATHQGKYVF